MFEEMIAFGYEDVRGVLSGNPETHVFRVELFDGSRLLESHEYADFTSAMFRLQDIMAGYFCDAGQDFRG
jgi:hypothetical protein